MGFNADEYLATLEVPTITIGGVEYKGKLLTFNEALSLQLVLSGLDTSNVESVKDAVTKICDAVQIPSDVVLQLPVAVALKAVTNFLAVLIDTKTAE